MFAPQTFDEWPGCRTIEREQSWKEIVLFVAVMVFAGGVEIAYDVRRRLLRLLVRTDFAQMFRETVEKLAAFLDAVVTGREHLERMIEIGRCLAEWISHDGLLIP
jgi:hypothetical protein